MPGDSGNWLDKAMLGRALRFWARAAKASPDADPAVLRRQRGQARQLQQYLNTLIHVAEGRLALPLIGNQLFSRPDDADWAWRPDLWCGPLAVTGLSPALAKQKLGQGVTMFHDCAQSELTLRQIRNQREADLAAYGLRMDVFRFDGSYLSLAVDLPDDVCDGLGRNHLVGLSTIVDMERPIEIFARLNVKHGPNTVQVVRELPLGAEEVGVEFDLAYSKMNEKRVEKAWVDLIFEGPQMNMVTLRDLTFYRRKRAAF